MATRPSYEPGAPIELGEDRITSVDGEPADIPVRMVQKIWPHQCFTFHAVGVPSNTPAREEPFRIQLNGHHTPLDVVVSQITVASPSLSTLVIHRQPYSDTEATQGDSFRSASFLVINLPPYHGMYSKMILDGGVNRLRASVTIEADPWVATIDEVPNIDDVTDFFKEYHGGRAVTHTGRIARLDGTVFNTEEALSAITRLEALLSFAAGRRCGVGEVCAQTPRGGIQRVLWGTTHAESWRRVHSCFPKNWGFDMIATLAPALFALDEATFRVVQNAIGWYVESNISPAHAGILLTQAALELLASHFTGGAKSRSPSDPIRSALTRCHVPTELPRNWPRRRDWDGPRAIVCVRNDFAHPEPKHGVSFFEQFQAHALGQWYTEMLLLHMLGYEDGYSNRLSRLGDPLFPDVPWARTEEEESQAAEAGESR